MFTVTRILLLIVCMTSLAMAAEVGGDAAHGKDIYQRVCGGCHSPDRNRAGPMHKGVYGRKAGTAPGFDYSKALKGSGLVWNDQTLDKWLAGPNQLVPGQKMNVQVDNPKDRQDVIAYLKTLH